jgi:hypothetical protein
MTNLVRPQCFFHLPRWLNSRHRGMSVAQNKTTYHLLVRTKGLAGCLISCTIFKTGQTSSREQVHCADSMSMRTLELRYMYVVPVAVKLSKPVESFYTNHVTRKKVLTRPNPTCSHTRKGSYLRGESSLPVDTSQSKTPPILTTGDRHLSRPVVRAVR